MKSRTKMEFFSDNTKKYDQWYERHQKEYREQVKFIRALIPKGKGIEIGVGTGRFAYALNIEFGVDYVQEMVDSSLKRGVKAILADATHLPFPDKFFDFTFSIVTMCFLDDPVPVLVESRRVADLVMNVILDRDCEYIQNIMKERRGFYKYATFYTEKELVGLYRKAGFNDISSTAKNFLTSEGETYRLVSVIGK